VCRLEKRRWISARGEHGHWSRGRNG
jgi:hypothetical protein